ncbi:MAG: hypothetical protein KBB51_02940 [Candidatus Moranbacteria bacterium]|nr:hypothetical protein [Candidatus Moranbacteria bacterium]
MNQGFAVFFDVWYLVLPPVLYGLFLLLWMQHVWGKWASKIKWIVLEIIPSRDIEKSPQPMESFFSGLAGVMTTPTSIEEYILGFIPVSFSLELVSTDGTVHFYIRTQESFRGLVESHFYAQYPDIEIMEVKDYVHNVPRTVPNKDWDLWGTDFELVKDDLYPIKTYKYFEESVTGKMIDPLSGLIEAMGRLGPGQHLWLQFITTPISEKATHELLSKTVDKFLGREKPEEMGIIKMFFMDIWDVIRNLPRSLSATEPEFYSYAVTKKDEQPLEFRLSPGEKDVLKALQSNLGKQMFKVRMRMIYLGRREGFSKAIGVSPIMGAIKQFSDQNLNGFKPNDASKTYAEFIMAHDRLRYRQRRLFRRYITRDGDPGDTKFILSAEEMATVFHLPDMSVVAPTLARVSAKRGNAPTNLPVQE